MILRIETEAQFMAIWNALVQFVDNQDDSVEESQWPADVRAQVEAARAFEKQFSAALAKLATR